MLIGDNQSVMCAEQETHESTISQYKPIQIIKFVEKRVASETDVLDTVLSALEVRKMERQRKAETRREVIRAMCASVSEGDRGQR